MADPVSALAGRPVALDPSLLQPPGTAAGPSGALDKDAFLKLLVAQLKYQDPLNPSSNEEFIATTAQFTTIEKLDELAAQSALASQVNGLATASALIGKQVSMVDAEGVLRTTAVLRASFAGGQLTLETEFGPVGLDQIVALTGSAPTPTTPTPTPEQTTEATPS